MTQKVLIYDYPSASYSNFAKDLLYGCWCYGKRIGGASFPPLHLLSIYTVLKSNCNVKILDSHYQRFNFDQLKPILKHFNWIILPSSFQTIEDDIKTCRTIKTLNPDIKIVIFGPTSTFDYMILKDQAIDFGIIGDPEIALRNLILFFDLNRQITSQTQIPAGVITRINHEIKFTPPCYPNLDEIPIPDRTPIKDISYFNPLTETNRWTSLFTSRGCPNRCIFCTSPKFYGKHFRFNSPERMIQEIQYLMELGYVEFFFRDESFTISKDRIQRFCELILEKGIKIRWICNSRVTDVSFPLLILMKRAGCHTIKFGVESGSQRVLNLLQKDITIEKTIQVFAWCKQIQIKTHAHMIFGMFGETKQDQQATFQLLKIIEPYTVTFNLFKSYPGSEIYSQILSKSILSITQIPANLIRNAYRQFYLRIKYIKLKLLQIKKINDIWSLIRSGFNVISYIFDINSQE